MKKLTLVTLILVMACTFVFAADEKISLNICPFSFSVYPTSNADDELNKSTGGMGAGVGFVTNLNDSGFLLGADVLVAKYKIVDRTDFLDVFATVRGGYQFFKTDKFAIEAYAKAGIDFEYFEYDFGFAPIFGLGFETEFKTAEHLCVFAGGEVFLSRADAEYKYFAYRFNTLVGLKYAF